MRTLVINQPDALFRVFIYSFLLSTCFEHQVLIIRISNCINKSSGMISLCKWLLGMQVRHTKQSFTQTNQTRWCINTIRYSDDEHLILETCRKKIWIHKYMKKFIRLVINKNLWRDVRSTKYKKRLRTILWEEERNVMKSCLLEVINKYIVRIIAKLTEFIYYLSG